MKSNKKLNEIADKIWEIENSAGNDPAKIKEAIPKIEKIASTCSFEELLMIDDIIYQKHSAADT